MPSIAPFVSAFKRRLANLPGPARSSGEASNGEPVQVEMRVAGAAVDITEFTMVRDDNGYIGLQRGIRAEASQAEAAESTEFQLRNTDGRFSPRNPTGPYFDQIGRNTEVWWSVPDGNGGKSYRLRGEVSDWSQGWERSGNDVWTDVRVSGILQRLAQGPTPERSVIYTAITDPLASSVVAYWPCEDPDGAAQIASALPNGSPMTFTTGAPDLAASTVFSSSDPLPTFTNAVATGGVVKYSDTTAIQVRAFFYAPAESLSDRKVIFRVEQEVNLSVSIRAQWEVIYNATTHSLSVVLLGPDGEYYTEIALSIDVRNRPLYISLEFEESGSDVVYTIRALDVLTGLNDSASLTLTEGLNRVTSVAVFPASQAAVGANDTTGLTGGVIGHITVENAVSSITALGTRLNPVGETAGRRIQRLCAENAIPFQWIGDLDDTAAMGGQGRSNPLTLMQECVTADGGMLYETTDVLGLGYRTRASLCNQDPALVLSYTGHNLSQVPTPVGDDRYLANRVTVTVGGVSATYEETEGRLSTAPPPAGVGVYGPNSDSGLPLNLATSDTATLLDHAAWRVHLGTTDEDRFPRISVNLAHPSFVNDPALKRAALGLRQGDRVQIENPPSWLPPDTIDQLILGLEEQITHFEHRITFVCAPASPYSSIGVLDAEDARIDIDSELVQAVSSSDTALVAGPQPGEIDLWTTDSADWPFDVRMGGEVMTVTSVTGWLEDTFTRSVSNSWGSPDAGSAWSTVGGGVAADYSVNGNAGVHTLSTVDVTRRTAVTAASPDFDLYCDITTSALATGASLYGAVTGRMQDSGTMYMARLEFTTSNTVLLALRRLVADVGVDLGAYTVPVTHVAGTYIRVRLQCIGPRLKAKAWLAADAVEPPVWNVSVTDSAISNAHSIGTRSITVTGNTNVNPQIRYDNYRVINPQTLTVTRSVNSAVKAHSAGAPISLAYPTIIDL